MASPSCSLMPTLHVHDANVASYPCHCRGLFTGAFKISEPSRASGFITGAFKISEPSRASGFISGSSMDETHGPLHSGHCVAETFADDTEAAQSSTL